MATGIYLWTVNRPGKVPVVYVGQALRIEQRRNEYAASWFGNRRKKENGRLTNAARYYGPAAVSFRVLELTEKARLTERELHWYWHYKGLEELGHCEVANDVVPSENPFNNPEVIARRSANSQWREGQTRRAKQARARVYAGFISPTGKVYRSIPELTEFCREHGLILSKMSEVANGHRPHHKGWTRVDD